MDLYGYADYKALLKDRLERGAQKVFAEYLGCQPAFLSQVLRGKPHLSLEQGILATEFFRMNRAESDYFMACLQYGRAGSEKLREFFLKKMESLAAAHRKVDSKIGAFAKIDAGAKLQFYSSWKYTLIHVLLSLPEKDQIETIERHTGLSRSEIQNALAMLLKNGIAQRKEGALRPSANRLHLDREDSLIGLHHRNFRALVLAELEEIKPDSIHYSVALAVSKADADRIREVLVEAVAQTEKIIRPSPEETVRVMCIDYFTPGH